MKTNKEMNVYVQPDCKVYQVKLQQVIATSPTYVNETVGNPFSNNTEEEW